MSRSRLRLLLLLLLRNVVSGLPYCSGNSSHYTNSQARLDRRNEDLTAGNVRIFTLVNGTPYRWTRGFIHSYGLADWDSGWVDMVPAGAVTQLPIRIPDMWDAAAEVAYTLEGTSKPMAFMVRVRSGAPHHVDVVFVDELETAGRPRGSATWLGSREFPGGPSFVLAGREGGRFGLVSTGGLPVGWMQMLLPAVGDMALRDVMLPRAHHAGMWKVTSILGLGSTYMTITQTRSLAKQLRDGGVRVLDVRPAMSGGSFFEHHSARIGCCVHGALGASIREMVDETNRFNRENPGELIIWDVGTDKSGDATAEMAPLDADARRALIDELMRLENRAAIGPRDDVTARTLNSFVGKGRPAVLVRISDQWADSADSPGPSNGFVGHRQFPVSDKWSDSDDVVEMSRSQIASLQARRPQRGMTAAQTQWILTQKGIGLLPVLEMTIPHINVAAWSALFGRLWPALSEDTYPSWLSMDVIEGSEFKDFTVAVNLCFVARQC